VNLSPKALALRLAIWCLLLAWAIWKMQGGEPASTGADEGSPAGTERRALERPPGLLAGDSAQPPTPALGMIDPEELQLALGRAATAATRCGTGTGTLRVTVGAVGLLRAEMIGPVGARGGAADGARSCLATAVWTQAWPSGPGEMEGEIGL
jgi:hypothetical protein